MIVANSPLSYAYHNLWKQNIYVGFNDFLIEKDLLHWINDGLMSMFFFFFLVGLELKKEIWHGELEGIRNIALPVAAVIGGMLFQALIYLMINSGTPAVSGWYSHGY